MRPWPTLKRFELVAAAVFLFILPFTHTVAIRLLCLAIAATTVLVAWYRNPPPTPPCKAPLSFWFAVCFLASIWSIEPEYSWGEFKNEVVYALLAFFTFYYLTTSDRVWRIWRHVLISAFCLISLHAIVNYIRAGSWAVLGFVGDRNAYSTYIIVSAPFVLLSLVQTRCHTTAGKWIWVTIPLALVSGFLTLNRIMWVTLMIEAAIFFFLYLRKSAVAAPAKRLARLAIIGTICALLTVQFFLVSYLKQHTPDMSVTQLEQSFSQDPRLRIWSYAAQRVAERPLTGYGYGRGILRKDFRTHFADPLHWHGHNMIVNSVIEAGPVGAVALVWLFAVFSLEFWKLYRTELRVTWELGAFGLALMLGVATKAMTDDILVRDNALLFWSLIGMSLGLARHSLTNEASRLNKTQRECIP